MEHAVHDTPPLCDYCGRPADYIGGEVGEGASARIDHFCIECGRELGRIDA